MRDLNFQIKKLCLNCKEDSFATQQNRLRELDLVANQLHDLGFRNLSYKGLKPKHVTALVELWKKDSISIGTIKNRMAYVRWWADKIGKFAMIPKDNASLGIDERVYVTNQSKATSLPSNILDKVSDPHIKLSLELQAAFGLRREECLKFVPSWADKGDCIILKGAWCKGGQQREVPLTNSLQREVLDKAHASVGFGSLIPPKRTFVQQLKVYEYQTSKAGLNRLHGLRHHYAQLRYKELAGWNSPAAGGLTKDQILSSSLSQAQKDAWIKIDNKARLIVSNELGHHRESITAVYLGR